MLKKEQPFLNPRYRLYENKLWFEQHVFIRIIVRYKKEA